MSEERWTLSLVWFDSLGIFRRVVLGQASHIEDHVLVLDDANLEYAHRFDIGARVLTGDDLTDLEGRLRAALDLVRVL